MAKTDEKPKDETFDEFENYILSQKTKNGFRIEAISVVRLLEAYGKIKPIIEDRIAKKILNGLAESEVVCSKCREKIKGYE